MTCHRIRQLWMDKIQSASLIKLLPSLKKNKISVEAHLGQSLAAGDCHIFRRLNDEQ